MIVHGAEHFGGVSFVDARVAGALRLALGAPTVTPVAGSVSVITGTISGVATVRRYFVCR